MNDPITYTVLAADGQQYGPFPAENVQTWINEGRILADQQMFRSDLTDWFRAGDFSEFAWTGRAASAPGSVRPPLSAATEPSGGERTTSQISSASLAAVRYSGSWFYWIAGLSAVNFGLALANTGFGLAVGSFFVDVCAALAKGNGTFNPAFAFAGALMIGLWAVFGVFACRGHVWAFAVGILAFGLDTLLLLRLLGFSVIGLLVHGYILYKLSGGLKDAWALRKALKG